MTLSGLSNEMMWSGLLINTMALSGLTTEMTWSGLLTNGMVVSSFLHLFLILSCTTSGWVCK